MPIEEAEKPRRFLWVIRHALEDTVAFRTLADSATSAGITDLLVQVRGRGEAYYRSSTEPAPRRLETDPPAGLRIGDRPSEESLRYDPLATAIGIARERGLGTHAWINLFLAASWGENRRRHIVVCHPEYKIRLEDQRLPEELPRSTRRRLNLEGIYLDPGNPEVRDYLIGVAEELVSRYALDGLHYDYVRYPTIDAGYNESTVRLFRDLERQGRLPDDPNLFWKNRWDLWRADRVSLTVAELSAVATAVRPSIEVSAAVVADPVMARRDTKQDWERWLEQGWCDRVFQMAYTDSRSRLDFLQRIAFYRDPQRRQIVPGLGLHVLEPGSLAQVLADLRADGIDIFAFFSDVELKQRPEFWGVLRRGGAGSRVR
jgi:uncharacterized lipoprotein YddW (UPF0748 family)